MAYDIAIDLATGDFIFSPSNDIAGVQGDQLLIQRVHVRLMIERGSFPYDPSDGLLGSRLRTLLRVPTQRALREAQLMIEEALAPMTDITVTNVSVEVNKENPREVDIHITFRDNENQSALIGTLAERTTVITIPTS